MSEFEIDVDRLREDMCNDLYGAFYAGGFGAALMEEAEIESASDEELIRIARKQGINLQKYIV